MFIASGSISTIPPLNILVVHPAAIYASRVPYGTVNVQEDEMLPNALEPNAKGSSISDITEVRLRQYSNADSLMLVTLLGMVTEVRPEHSQYLQVAK